MLARASQIWCNVKAWFWGIGWVRRRILLIMMSLVGGWVVTGFVIYIFQSWLLGQYLDDMARGVLAAWMGELIFFTVVGGVITIVTLRNPMQEGFDERIKIMFGRLQVPDAVMKYNKDVISKLSAYVKNGSRHIYLEQYDETRLAYRARIRTEYHIFNLFPDVEFHDTIKIGIKPDDFGNNEPNELGRVVSIKLDSVETVTNPLIIGKIPFASEVKLEIPPNGSRVFILEFVIWIKVGDTQLLRPQRVLEHFSMDIVSQCDQNPRVDIDGDVRVLLYNQPIPFPLVQGVSPGDKICVYKPLTPEP